MTIERKRIRDHARDRGALDGVDAQALEHALTMTERERDRLRAMERRLEEWADLVRGGMEAASEDSVAKIWNSYILHELRNRMKGAQ